MFKKDDFHSKMMSQQKVISLGNIFPTFYEAEIQSLSNFTSYKLRDYESKGNFF